MRILVIGTARHLTEYREKFPQQDPHQVTFQDGYAFDEDLLDGIDLVFDFLIEDLPENIVLYQNRPGLIVFCSAVRIQLALLQHLAGKPACALFGFNGLPTFFNRPVLEVSLLNPADSAKLAETCAALGTDYLTVADRVGMVTPRVICMIINEACYTLQEGTASIPDIDLGMKLGTNYPFGPFEWANRIGVQNVYRVLQAVYEDTRDERYKICPLLKTLYLKEEAFELQ